MENVVAQNVRKIIGQKGLKNKAVAKMAGYSEKQFSNLLTGRRVISYADVITISRVLNVTPNDLFGISERATQTKTQ